MKQWESQKVVIIGGALGPVPPNWVVVPSLLPGNFGTCSDPIARSHAVSVRCDVLIQRRSLRLQVVAIGKHSEYPMGRNFHLFVLGPFPFLQPVPICGHVTYRHTIYQFSEHVASSEGQTIGSVFGAINYSVCGPENGEVHQWIAFVAVEHSIA
jgi:hypothetical protein